MKMNSRQLAQKWPFPRHKAFEKILQNAAANWFKTQGYPTRVRMPYCLQSWGDWKHNIILDEVANYIESFKADCERNGKPFPLHKYVHHGLSSQAMTFNLIGPLITRNDFDPFMVLLDQANVNISNDIISASFEYEDRAVFNEDSGQPTSIDVVLKNKSQDPVVFIEAKLVEKEFGGCTVFSNGDCNGQNPLSEKDTCYLHFIGRKYWDLVEKYGFTKRLRSERQCIFVAHYQFFREVLFSLEKGGTFILLSDERSPVFHCSGYSKSRGLMPFLMDFVPDELIERIAFISVQKLANIIKRSDKHSDWIDQFEIKYGLT
jgi:hypothetical protein